MTALFRRPRRRLTLFELINHPATDIVVMALIVASVFLLVVEESFDVAPTSRIHYASQVITAVFALELILRFLAARKKARFFRRYWPDLLALLPLLRPLRFFRFFRLFRLFRLFQLGLLLDRRVSTLRGILRVNFTFLWALMVLTVILVIGSAVMGFILEQHQGGDFQSVERSMWWAMFTIIAGEPVGGMPQTFLGRGLLALMMLSGMGIFAVFTGVVSATMMSRLQGRDRVAELDIDELEGHILIFGYNAGVPPLLAELAVDPELKGLPVVLVNEREREPDLSGTGYRMDLVYFMRGDYTQVPVLNRAGVPRASRAVVMADDIRSHDPADRDARSVLTALTVERLNSKIFCVVELMNSANRATLSLVKVEAVINRSDLAGRALASACRHPNLMEVMMNLLTMRRGEMMHRVPGPREPTPFSRLMILVKSEVDAILVGIERDGETRVNPPEDLMVGPEDFLILVGGPEEQHVRRRRLA